MTDVPDSGLWAGAATGITAIGLYLSRNMRPGRQANHAKCPKEDKFSEQLLRTVESQDRRIDQVMDACTKQIAEMGLRLDSMAHQRNAALVENAKLTERVEHLTSELAEAEKRIGELAQEVASMRAPERRARPHA